MKKEFIDYIATESSAPNSAKNYTSGLNAISKIIGTDIFRITNPKEIKDIIQELKENNKFIELDKHNNMYSNAIKHYLKFLESKKTEKISQNEDISLNELQILLTKELLQTVINNEPNVSYKELADRHTKEQRHKNMQAVKAKNTKLENNVMTYLWVISKRTFCPKSVIGKCTDIFRL